MAELAGCGLETEVAVLRKMSRAAWDAAEQAKIALYRHEADHCCDRPSISKAQAAS